MSEELTMNIYQKLAKIRSIADAVKKDKKGFNYNYADITEILAKVTAGMNKYGISLIPSAVPGSFKVEQVTNVKTKTTKDGAPYDQTTTEMLVSGDMIFTWVNDADPSDRIEVPWFLTGMQEDPSQAFGSGDTYTTRYFLTSYFQIAQPETDVDTYRSKQKKAEAEEEASIAESIVKEYDIKVRDYLSSHPDDASKVKELTTKYIKSGDYTKIKEPKLASKMLDEFLKEFMS